MLFAVRTAVHESTFETPFYLMFGRDPILPLDTRYLQPDPCYVVDQDDYKFELTEKLQLAWKLAKENMTWSQERQKKYYDRNAVESCYLPGDVVLRYTPISVKGRSKKFSRPWRGPYRIIEMASDGLNAILLPYDRKQGAKPYRVHVNRLKVAYLQPVRDLLTPPAIEEAEDGDTDAEEKTSSPKNKNEETNEPDKEDQNKATTKQHPQSRPQKRTPPTAQSKTTIRQHPPQVGCPPTTGENSKIETADPRRKKKEKTMAPPTHTYNLRPRLLP